MVTDWKEIMQSDDVLSLLSHVECFAAVASSEWTILLERGDHRLQEYSPGTVIHLQHDRCQTLDVLLAGRVAVQRIDDEGRVLTIDTFSAPDIVGANLLFSRRNRYPMTVMAETHTRVLQLSRDHILQLCSTNRPFLVGFLRLISERSLILTDTIHTLSTPSVRRRILDYLRYQRLLQNDDRIRLPESKKALAERLGMQRTSLSRELRKMKDEGLLDFDAQHIVLY